MPQMVIDSLQHRAVSIADDAQREALALLALGATKGVGYRVLHRIFEAGVRFSTVLAQSGEDSLREVLEGVNLKNAKSLARAIVAERQTTMPRAVAMADRLSGDGIRLIHAFEADFPRHLLKIPNSPGWLFVEGNLAVLARPLVAVVGTRTPSSSGRFLTECVCRILADTDIGTVSGLAAGIDEMVHQLSVSLGLPTVAVLGTGILRDYPAHSRPMRDAIVRHGGCVLSEYLPEEGPGKESFVWRNRLQAGLASVVIPTEWQIASGTAHTVNFALKAGKPVVGVHTTRLPSETSKFLTERQNLAFRMPAESMDLLEHVCRVLQ